MPDIDVDVLFAPGRPTPRDPLNGKPWHIYFARNCISALLVVLTYIAFRQLLRIYSFIHNIKKRGFDAIEPGILKLVKFLCNPDPLKLLTELSTRLESSKHGVVGWISPVGRPFMLVSNDEVLQQVLVQHQDKIYNTHYMLEITEYFRKTQISIGPSWKILHTTISKFSIFNRNMLANLNSLVVKNTKQLILQDAPPVDFALAMNHLHWEVAVALCLGGGGKIDETLCSLLRQTWDSLLVVASHPFSHIFESIFPSIPLPCVSTFLNNAAKLRKYLINVIKGDNFPEFAYISSLKHLSADDKLEVILEFILFVAHSVSSTVVWLVWHLSLNQRLANAIRQEIYSAVEKAKTQIIDVVEEQTEAGLGTSVEQPAGAPPAAHSKNSKCPTVAPAAPPLVLEDIASLPDESTTIGKKINTFSSNLNHLSNSSISSLKLLDAAYKETLRLYSPMQICRYTKQELPINVGGEKLMIPKGTNILCNNWFIHRNSKYWKEPHTFDHTRFISEPSSNKPTGTTASPRHFHPFSIGLRICPGMDIATNIVKLITAAVLLQTEDFEPLSDKLSPKFVPNFATPVSPGDVFIKFKAATSQPL